MSSDPPVTFTRTEYEAFNLTFDALKRALVIGPDKYRVADPSGKVAHLFRREEEAQEFIARLVRLRLFEDAVAGGPNGAVPAYIACQAHWVEFVSRIKVVPDPPMPPAPPFRSEERVLAAARDERARRLADLGDRRESLRRELESTEAAIADVGREVVEIDGLLAEVRAIGAKITRFVAAAPASEEATE